MVTLVQEFLKRRYLRRDFNEVKELATEEEHFQQKKSMTGSGLVCSGNQCLEQCRRDRLGDGGGGVMD